MGHTRVIYTDATTAEAAVILKGKGFHESPDGGCFLSRTLPIKVYLSWGKANYYPELMRKLPFTPRIQIHFKCKENSAGLTELAKESAVKLKKMASNNQVRLFDIDANTEIHTSSK